MSKKPRLPLLPLLLFLASCGTDLLYERSDISVGLGYPYFTDVLRFDYTDTDNDLRPDIYFLHYDLDKDQQTDLICLYQVERADNTALVLSHRPFELRWVNGKGRVYATQFDEDMDGKIDAVSGETYITDRWYNILRLRER